LVTEIQVFNGTNQLDFPVHSHTIMIMVLAYSEEIKHNLHCGSTMTKRKATIVIST